MLALFWHIFCSGASFFRSWTPLAHLLGVIFVTFDFFFAFWVAPGRISGCSGTILKGFQSSFDVNFPTPRISSHNALKDAVSTLWHLLRVLPCSAVVRAQHIRRLPKGCRACQTVIHFILSVPASKLHASELGFRFLPPRPSPILLFLPPDPHIPPHFVRNLLLTP